MSGNKICSYLVLFVIRVSVQKFNIIFFFHETKHLLFFTIVFFFTKNVKTMFLNHSNPRQSTYFESIDCILFQNFPNRKNSDPEPCPS